MLLEICIDSLESAKTALAGGADRIELCSALSEGGLTPSLGLMKAVKRISHDVPVFCMIRPSSGDFVYSSDDLELMLTDLRLLKDSGADGFVFGALTSDGYLDEVACQRIISAAQPLPVTLHRAIDASLDPSECGATAVKLGFRRILTSGGAASALEGLPTISRMQSDLGQRIIIMAGGGINGSNVHRIVEGAGITEVHASCRRVVPSTSRLLSAPLLSQVKAVIGSTRHVTLLQDVEELRKNMV